MKEETETLLEDKERKEEEHVVAWLEKLEKPSEDQQPSEQLGFLKM